MTSWDRVKDALIGIAWGVAVVITILALIELGATLGELKCRVEQMPKVER